MCVCNSLSVSDSLSPMNYSPPGPLSMRSPGKNTGVGCHLLLQWIFPTQGSNSGLLHCGQMLYTLSHEGNPVLTAWGKGYTQAQSALIFYKGEEKYSALAHSNHSGPPNGGGRVTHKYFKFTVRRWRLAKILRSNHTTIECFFPPPTTCHYTTEGIFMAAPFVHYIMSSYQENKQTNKQKLQGILKGKKHNLKRQSKC